MSQAAGMDLPSLLYSEAEDELRAAVRSALDDRAGWRAVLARTETDEPYDNALWHVLAADVGCAGLLIPEPHGGAGASYREAAVVAEEVGRSVAPVPYLGSAVVATAALLESGDGTLIKDLASGSVTAALAIPFATSLSVPAPLGTVRVAAPQPGDPQARPGCAGQWPGWPTRCQRTCCSCPPTGCRTACTPWTGEHPG